VTLKNFYRRPASGLGQRSEQLKKRRWSEGLDEVMVEALEAGEDLVRCLLVLAADADHQHSLASRALANFLGDLEAAFVRQRDVKQYDIGIKLAHQRQHARAVVNALDVVALVSENHGQRQDGIALIIRYDDAQRSGHTIEAAIRR
jgi:hypothetical protein